MLCALPAAAGSFYSTNAPGSDQDTRRWAVALVYSTTERDVEEYDDLWTPGLDVDGSAEIEKTTAEISCCPLHQLEFAFRVGLGSAEISDFDRVTYRQQYDVGPAWGIGVRSYSLLFEEYGVLLKTFFNFDYFEPEECTIYLTDRVQTFDASVEDWELGIEAIRIWRRFRCSFGIRYSDLQIKYEHKSLVFPGEDRQGGFQATRHFGAFLGAACETFPNLCASLALHSIDVSGMTVGISYRF